ncbi:MAG TPA: hypothetical protein VN603_06805 [Candidatus Acidoferrales bacterium]|nr:hypothetical protein [Candidatus Acidoferrales bacterium]
MSGNDHSPTFDGRAFGCRFPPRDLKIVHDGEIAGFPACRSNKGCWHVDLHADHDGKHFAAEICMNTEHALRELVGQYIALPRAKQAEFLCSLVPLQRDAAIARMVAGFHDLDAPDAVARQMLREKGLR